VADSFPAVPSIYRTPEGRAELLAWYDAALAALPLAVESRRVPTRFGETHLLAAGPAGAPPVCVVHGGNGSALEMAAAFGALAETQRCYFLDVPGEPNRSSETRPDKADGSYARWIGDVLAALGIERTGLLGMSQGGFVALACCAAFPERLSRVVLLVPEGFAKPRPLVFLPRVVWPIFRYRRRPTEANARRVVAAIAGMPAAAVPAAAIARMGLALRHVRTVARLGRPFAARDLAGLRAPVLLVVGGCDPIFPGGASLRRARAIVPNLVDAIVIPHAGHAHPDLVAPPVTKRIAEFLAADAARAPRAATGGR
jgi:pimeloyl-ACP methyl ester carboxylesterase